MGLYFLTLRFSTKGLKVGAMNCSHVGPGLEQDLQSLCVVLFQPAPLNSGLMASQDPTESVVVRENAEISVFDSLADIFCLHVVPHEKYDHLFKAE